MRMLTGILNENKFYFLSNKVKQNLNNWRRKPNKMFFIKFFKTWLKTLFKLEVIF